MLKDFDKLINSYKGCAINEWTSKVLNYVIAGNKKSWSGDRDNPYDLAKAFEAAGDSEQDTYKLQLAENNYLRANMPQKAKECRAKRLEIIDQCEDAGVLYEELSLFDKALFCYWKLDNYDRIVNNIAFSDKIYYKAAKFKKSQKTKEDIYNFLKELTITLKMDSNKNICNDPKWGIFMDDVAKTVTSDLSKFDCKQIYNFFRELESFGITTKLNHDYAIIAYNSFDYKYAVKLWEASIEKYEHLKEYKESKAYTETYPNNLTWYKQLQYNDKIIEQWRINKSKNIDSNYIELVSNAMINAGRYEDLFDLFVKYPNEAILYNVYNQINTINDKELVGKVGRLYLKTLMDNLKWDEAIHFIEEEQDENIKNKLKLSLIYRIATIQDIKYADIHQTGSAEFLEIEFTGQYSINKLCEALKKDKIDIKENTLSEINNVLMMNNLYEKIMDLKNTTPSNKIERLYESYKKSKSEDTLKILNRSLLEEFYSELTPKSRSSLSLFIKENVIFSDELNIPLSIAGAAVENVNTFLEAIRFYERFWKKMDSGELFEFALKRWIACKIKYSNYLSKIDTPNTTAKQNYSETVAKHRIDAEEICKKYLKINPYSIPLNPEIKYSDEEENAFLSSIEIAKIPKETKDGILELYNQKWNVEKIARSYNLNEKMVEKVVKFYKQ